VESGTAKGCDSYFFIETGLPFLVSEITGISIWLITHLQALVTILPAIT